MSLEAAITLDDVFAVVGAKRVPLAAELAGYLALEIADGTDAGSGDVDPKTVFISEEGTVALVRPKKEIVTGDAEASVRSLLVRLLEASGSSTPALGAAAKRKPGNGLPALVEELEAALIPVNRAAGRRALARLSREVKRVTQGVGRNASAPKPEPAPAGLKMETPLPKLEPPKLEIAKQLEDPKHDPLAPTPIAAPLQKSGKLGSIPPPPGVESKPPPPPPKPDRTPGPPSALFAESELDHEEPAPPEPTPPKPKNDDVDALLAQFEVSKVDDKQLGRDLKAMAGLSPTPPHPELKAIADLGRDVGKGSLRASLSGEQDSVAELLALADASLPAPAVTANHGLPPVKPEPVKPAAGVPAIVRQAPPESPPPPPVAKKSEPVFQRTSSDEVDIAPPQRKKLPEPRPARASRTGMTLLVIALLGLAAATVAIYNYAPHLFVGKKPAPPPPPSALVPPPKAQPCRLTLVVTDAPARSEILVRVGQAPVDVDQMPVGARLELVATAEGYAPRRAVIPAEAVWDKGPDGKPRIEVPIQLDPSHPKAGTVDPWPSAEPSSEVGGSGAPGTVHVVSNVRGAEIWLMAGLGPQATMEQKCDGDVDILVAAPTPPASRKRLHVSDKEIAAAAPDAKGNKTVTVSAAGK